MAAQLRRWGLLENRGDVYTARTGHTVASHEGCFYLFGGTDGSARQSDAHAYNQETNIWCEIRANGRPPPARSGAQAVVWNGAVWFFGGYTKKDGDYFNDVFTFDIATSTWDIVATPGESPQKRTDHSVCLFSSSMLVFGGSDGRSRFNDLWELNLSERRWTRILTQQMAAPRSRFAHTAVMYNNAMFVFGGWDGQDTLQEFFEYNVSSNMWIQLPLRGTAPRARYRHTSVVCGDAMFMFGGVDKAQYRFPDLHEYNFITKSWNKVNTTGVMPSARTFHKAVVHEGYMYILGGFDGRRLNDMHCIQLRTKQDLNRLQDDKNGRGSAASQFSNAVPSGSSHAAVGDAQDSASTLMPEDMWIWNPVEMNPHQAQRYTPRTGHAVVVWNHCFYLMAALTRTHVKTIFISTM